MESVTKHFQDKFYSLFNLRFHDKELDKSYVVFNNERACRMGTAGVALGVIAFICLEIILYFLQPEIFADTYKLVFLAIVPIHFFLAVLIFHLGAFYYLQWLLLTANIVSGLCISILFFKTPEQFAISYGYGTILIVNLYSFAMLRLRFFFALISSIVVVSQYFLMLIFLRDLEFTQLIIQMAICFFVGIVGWSSAWFFERFSRQEYLAAQLIEQQAKTIQVEKEKSEALVMNILPPQIAARLLSGEKNIADRYNNVTILFADLNGFTALSQKTTPEGLVQLLDELFSKFDEVARRYDLEKIKTIGDAYMAAAGLPRKRREHAASCVQAAKEMVKAIEDYAEETGADLSIRVGIASGPVVAGVIGHNKFFFDVWGETVNAASRMESQGIPGRIHITERTKDELGNQFQLEERGVQEIKGLGQMKTYLVV